VEQRDSLGRSLEEQIADAQADAYIPPLDDDYYECEICGGVQSVYTALDIHEYRVCNDCYGTED